MPRLLCLLLLAFSPLAIYGEDLATPNEKNIVYPGGKAPSKEEIYLGKVLFFDKRVSKNSNVSCATCHNPDLGWGDGNSFSQMTGGEKQARHVPHLYNLAWNSVFFWDGRTDSLNKQASGLMSKTKVMDLPADQLIPKLQQVKFYRDGFKKVFKKEGMTMDTIAAAMASFERTIITKNSSFDKYLKGDKSAMSPEAINGMALFKGKANCIKCHDGANLTDEGFHNIGLNSDDVGRFKQVEKDLFKRAFRTSGLRNIALSAPYMHDGSIPSLLEVVKFYNRGGDRTSGIDEAIKPLELNDTEMMELVAFLGSLTEFQTFKRPTIPGDNDPFKVEKI